MTETVEHFDKVVNERRSVRLYDTDVDFDSMAVTRSLQRALLAPNSSNLQLWEFYQVSTKEKKDELAKLCLGQPAATTANELVVVVTRRDLAFKRINWMQDVMKRSFDKAGIKDETKTTKDAGHVLKKIGNDANARRRAVMQYYGKVMPQYYKMDGLGILGWIKYAYVSLIMAAKGPTVRQVRRSDLRIVSHKSAALAAQTFMLSMKAEGYDTCPMEGMDSKLVKKFLNLPSGAEINMIIACGKGKPAGIYGPRIRVPEDEVLFKI